MKKHTLKAAPAAGAVETSNDNKAAKAKRILVGCDAHLRGYQTARKIDDGPIGVGGNFRREVELLLYVAKQGQQAEQVVVVYEAGPLGYTLYRKLRTGAVSCYVCAPDSSQQRRRRVKNKKIDARSLTSKLFNYHNGGQRHRHAFEPGPWELEQLVASEGLEPVEQGGAAVAFGEASDLGRCAQDP